jgi:hypothetical protein
MLITSAYVYFNNSSPILLHVFFLAKIGTLDTHTHNKKPQLHRRTWRMRLGVVNVVAMNKRDTCIVVSVAFRVYTLPVPSCSEMHRD